MKCSVLLRHPLFFTLFLLLSAHSVSGQAGLGGIRMYYISNVNNQTLNNDIRNSFAQQSQAVHVFHNFAAKEDNHFWRFSFGLTNMLTQNEVAWIGADDVITRTVRGNLDFGPGLGYGTIITGTDRFKLTILAEGGIRYQFFTRDQTTNFNQLSGQTAETITRTPAAVRGSLNLVPGLQWFVTPAVVLGWEVQFGPSISYSNGRQRTATFINEVELNREDSRTGAFTTQFHSPQHLLTISFVMDKLFKSQRGSTIPN